MNPFEVIIIAVSGALILSLTSDFLIMIMNQRNKTIDELDLINILNIYNRGLNLDSDFKVVYTPNNNGTLVINNELIILNNASSPVSGMKEINCSYYSLLITESGINCLKQ